MGGSTRCTALTLGAKALKSPVVPSEGLPHKKKPAGREPAVPRPHLSVKRKSRPPGRSGDGFRLPVNKTVRPVRRNANLAGGLTVVDPNDRIYSQENWPSMDRLR